MSKKVNNKLKKLMPGTMILEICHNARFADILKFKNNIYLVLSGNSWLHIRENKIFKVNVFPKDGNIWKYEIVNPSPTDL